MVVAEVPLWVVHSNANAPSSGAKNHNKGEGTASTGRLGSYSGPGAAAGQTSEERASKSLLLLDGGPAAGGSLQKAAIYSVDVHGNRFATGGGDGTIRIWNARALFPKPKLLIKNRYRRVGGDPSVGPAGDANNTTIASTNTLGTNATASANNNYESSGESSQDETIGGANLSASPESSSKSNQPADPVRDLSNVVRRKGEASSADRKPPKQQAHSATAADTHGSGDNDNDNDNKITHKHRLLCTLSAHTGSSVLAVRFSNNGKYLASAGDDAVVCVYTLQPQSSGTGAMVARGNLESTSCTLEHWIRIKLCRGHGLDAVGLAWAPDDSHLVSCSLDSKTPIIVWKLTDLAEETDGHTEHNFYNNVLCNPYKILGKGVHTSTVKGVTFDPAGTYLASSGDDPSVCIWRAHDDWGLEKRIDAKSGIFRQWNISGGNGNGAASVGLALSSQSLFRRLSWSTDGAYICATNAVVKNKNVASTISREGWAVSSSKSTATGAVNLVGHKQPVVAACHCPYLLDARSRPSGEDENGNDDDSEPEYSTLLALGDKRGFVTVWSTRKARPIFKIQCSETRCTVTDLSWGRLPVEDERHGSSTATNAKNQSKHNLGDLILLVSLLDGQVVALRFGIPDEFGKLLSAREQARVFQLRYGIDLNDSLAMGGSRRLFVGDNSGRPKFIENALQFSLELSNRNRDDGEDSKGAANGSENRLLQLEAAEARQQASMSAEDIRRKQLESRSRGGKKRIQPLLMQTTALPLAKKPKLSNGDKQNKATKIADTLETAMELAEKAASGAAAVAAAQKISSQKASTTIVTANQGQIVAANSGHHQPQQQQPNSQSTSILNAQANIHLLAGTHSTPQIPHSTDRIHSVDLPLMFTNSLGGEDTTEASIRYVADCTNSIRVPKGSSGSSLACTVLSISKGGRTLWNDQLLGSSCCAIAASESWLVVGTSDGSLQIYGTSPTMGWKTASAFRSHPPFVLGRPIVALHLYQQKKRSESSALATELVVVTSDGRFAVYTLEPRLKLRYKGSLLPAMTHMVLSADLETDLYLPKLARIQLTETGRLLLLLSFQSAANTQAGRNFGADDGRSRNQSPSVGAGGSLQGFLYDRESELWMRVADSRFVLSDFYNTLPSFSSSSSQSASSTSSRGELSQLDDSVRMGAAASTLQRSRKSRSALLGKRHRSSAYQITTDTTTSRHNDDGSGNDVASRSHCEDRMACALALGSSSEFESWFSRYIKILSLTGNESLLRLVIDMLLGKYGKKGGDQSSASVAAANTARCWWLTESPRVLGLDRVNLVRTVVVPEMSKNRALQRMTNETAIEVEGYGT
mmetsp:Transcript_15709/g.36320  ORF Transcript_15709/g.36320 Transcript_15709/m.36320 type:complete len:1325 (-) Transcript_15709:213-4187(-)